MIPTGFYGVHKAFAPGTLFVKKIHLFSDFQLNNFSSGNQKILFSCHKGGNYV